MTSSNNNMPDAIQWIEDGISNHYINYHDYNEFQNIEPIGFGRFGEVYQANWKNSKTVVSLKSFKSDSPIMKEIVNESQSLYKVCSHTNIIGFFGITKRKNDESNDYLVILEYAGHDTLRNYLNDNFNKLNWDIKLQFAIQIADAVSYMHQKNIIHDDLNSNNILVYQDMIKLANFGLSRKSNKVSSSNKNIPGKVSYVDASEKSDVYSVGVLLWELSSGQKSFESYDGFDFTNITLNGKRETPISDTPIDYINIYTRCWDDNPDNRPDMQQVIVELKSINLNTASENESRSDHCNDLTLLKAAEPFFPWIESVTFIINEIINRYETVEYNKRTCLIFIERVEMIGLSVKTLTRHRKENFEKFQNEDYHHSFVRLHIVLKNVKDFIDDISELRGYRKFTLASDVKDKANQLLNKLEACGNDLQFSLIITCEARRKEQQSFDVDVAYMTKFLASIEEGVSAKGENISNVVCRIYEMASVIMADRQTIFNAQTINPNDITENTPIILRGNTIRKGLLRNKIPVACKVVYVYATEKMLNSKLSIMNSIQYSNKIIKFHGKFHVKSGNDHTVLVFDWAEHGNLRGLYQTKSLSWLDKIKIAHDIASGLVFLQACNILHYDIRCKNILITGDTRYEAKIANFKKIDDLDARARSEFEAIGWLAPEQMSIFFKPDKKIYNFKCEVFSFGMLLWELGAQKLPYNNMDMHAIVTHVTNEERESFKDFNVSSIVVKDFMRIIESAWVHECNQRPAINELYQELDDLLGTTIYSLTENNDSTTTPEWEDDHLKALEPILTLEEGLKAHREGMRDLAWKCFEIHATLDNPMAIFWQGYYYLKGYSVKANRSEAVKYFKRAADANVPGAQYHFACAMKKSKKSGFLKYFAKAAENGFPLAQRELGLIYYYGSGVEMDKELGIMYLKSAALKDCPAAIEDLKKIDSNFY